MEVQNLEIELKKTVDAFVKKGSMNPWDLTELALTLVLQGIQAYRKVEKFSGSQKKQFVSESVNKALKPLLDKDIESIPNWIEEPAEGMLISYYIPKYIDKFFEMK